MILDKKISDLLNEISSSSPTPGGGSVSALCGTLASALSLMMANLTIGKKKYEDVQAEINELMLKINEFQPQLLKIYDEDSAAFEGVISAFKLPKNNEDEINIRKKAIENATIKAAEVPFKLIELTDILSDYAIRLSEIGNKNSLSDIGVSLLLYRTAAEGAYLNVMINAKSINNNTLNDLLNKATILSEKLKLKIDNKLSYIISEIKK